MHNVYVIVKRTHYNDETEEMEMLEAFINESDARFQTKLNCAGSIEPDVGFDYIPIPLTY